MNKYKFSIIVPHYDGVISDEVFIRGMDCLKKQTFKDFEVLIYHDGPISRPIPDIDIPNSTITVTEKRFNDWGHSLRDKGIKEAKGEYILHFNPDNILYDYALQEIVNRINKPLSYYTNLNPIKIDTDNTLTNIIFPIIMIGVECNGQCLWRVKEKQDETTNPILTGYPPSKHNIDCMQLVVRREFWLREGGWYDKTEQSDGNMYPKLVKKYGAKYCNRVLGEHR